MGIKLGTGLASGSLGLVSEALHSGTDLVAALLTFFAIGVASQPADLSHPYGHGKAEHLAALAEAFVLLLVSLVVGALALARIAGWIEIETSTAWWVFAAVGVVITIDVSRTLVSLRAARRFESPALASNALHFGSDLVGTLAVLAGLLAVRAGWPAGDSVAALFVAFLVVSAAGRLIRRNVDVLMDRAPADAVLAARAAIARLDPPVELRRLRLREAAGRTFTDVVIGVSPGAAVGQGHAVADRVEAAVHGALPGSDVVVHVEPAGVEAALRERVRESAMSVSRVREIHNLSVIELPDGVHVSLHLKLPGELPLDEAHTIAEHVERAIIDGRARGGRRADPPRAAGGACSRPRGGRGPGRDRAARPRRDGRAAAGGSLPPHRRGPRRLPDARARSGREPRRRTCDGHERRAAGPGHSNTRTWFSCVSTHSEIAAGHLSG